MEPLQVQQSPNLNRLPTRKRKPDPEFITALNLLAESYTATTEAKDAYKRAEIKLFHASMPKSS